MLLARRSLLASFVLIAGLVPAAFADDAKPPAVGDAAADFTLHSLSGEKVQLSELTRQGPVVLVVLRGFPGYQCPACTAQVGEFSARARQFAEAKANVVLVYPGVADGLGERAKEFVGTKVLPTGFHLVTDPDYTFTNKYHLRWDKEDETAYPATFVIDGEGKIRFASISRTHKGRASAKTVLEELKKL
ncbi:MAG: peroxiredoxin family protein [Pirellulaceae bacterium]